LWQDVCFGSGTSAVCCFAQLRDWSAEVQLLLENSVLEHGRAADFTKAIDLGDLSR